MTGSVSRAVAPHYATRKQPQSTNHRGPEQETVKVDPRYLRAALAWPPGTYRDPPPDGPRSAEALRHLAGYWTPAGRDTLARVLRRAIEHGRSP
jgi:hypothetical protein